MKIIIVLELLTLGLALNQDYNYGGSPLLAIQTFSAPHQAPFSLPVRRGDSRLKLIALSEQRDALKEDLSLLFTEHRLSKSKAPTLSALKDSGLRV
ncbi:hypothetical protein GNI_073130 [Gregarina niphandrodes]|uniref:Transmembrane protein n=1 Tax=Gregarina niphandrodes TaxID=110365 RepID=A0A023B769_GRENI|nr:hypothetical protein GNI_073130 [Gregarina niphandrodes]EZG67005.1 hypothetical protein GNI_073130 [Gregarina niphandrodes]|eukprot:XP_011130392.1 hypothetical protein GNI_073130 [Gregarina niphandrodes]